MLNKRMEESLNEQMNRELYSRVSLHVHVVLLLKKWAERLSKLVYGSIS